MLDENSKFERYTGDYEWNPMEREKRRRGLSAKGKEWLLWAAVFVGLFMGFHLVIELILPSFLGLA